MAEVTRESKIILSNARGNPNGTEVRNSKKVSTAWRSGDFDKSKKEKSKKTFETAMKKNIELQNLIGVLESDNFENPDKPFLRLDFVSSIISENFNN